MYMKTIKGTVTALTLALTLAACDSAPASNGADSAGAAPQAKVTPPETKVDETPAPTCHALVSPFLDSQHYFSKSSVWRCTENCGSLGFNEISLSQVAPIGSSPAHIKATLTDVEGDTSTTVSCNDLGAGLDPFLESNSTNELRLPFSTYSCPQKIPVNETYEAHYDCDHLVINGATFNYDHSDAGA